MNIYRRGKAVRREKRLRLKARTPLFHSGNKGSSPLVSIIII